VKKLYLSDEFTSASKKWQKLHSHAYTHATVCSFVSFTYYLIYLRRWIARKIRLWRCLFIICFRLTVVNSDMN
jgi:hypothetical protein